MSPGTILEQTGRPRRRQSRNRVNLRPSERPETSGIPVTQTPADFLALYTETGKWVTLHSSMKMRGADADHGNHLRDERPIADFMDSVRIALSQKEIAQGRYLSLRPYKMHAHSMRRIREKALGLNEGRGRPACRLQQESGGRRRMRRRPRQADTDKRQYLPPSYSPRPSSILATATYASPACRTSATMQHRVKPLGFPPTGNTEEAQVAANWLASR